MTHTPFDALNAAEGLIAKKFSRIRELEMALSIIMANATIVPDPRMNGTTDIYAVPLEDIETARAILVNTGETK